MISEPAPLSPVIREDLPPGRSIIVVSDLHMGGGGDTGTSARFCRFLDYVRNLKAGTPVSGQPFHPPAKVILLGDIFDLWDPRDQDRDNVYIDGIPPFLRLGQLDCDLVYVTGNHDEDIGDIIAAMEKRNKTDAKQKGNGTGAQEQKAADGIPLLGKSRLGIFRGVYPDMGQCLEIGGVNYSFPHGQQFDLQQITHTVSECMGNRFDPIDFIEDLANISFSKKIPRWGHILIVLAIAIFFWINLNLDIHHVVPLITSLFWGIVLFALFAYFLYFWLACRTKQGSGIIAVILLVLFLVLGGLMYLYNPMEKLYPFYPILLTLCAFVIYGISLPRLFVYLKRSLYSGFNPAATSLDETADRDRRLVLFRNTRRLLRPEEIAAHADVIVFGHTHWVDHYCFTFIRQFSLTERLLNKFRKEKPQGPPDGKKYLLINTGAWDLLGSVERTVNRTAGQWEHFAKKIDTFAYIDNAGISLMEWVCDPDKPGEDKMNVLRHFDKDRIIRAREDLHIRSDAPASPAPSS